MIRSLSLRAQLFLLQLLIVLVVVLVVGAVTVRMQEQQIRDEYQARMIGVAQSVAKLPTIIDAFGHAAPSETIQPIAQLIAQSTGVTYVVVTDHAGIRYSHPNPALIGKMVSTDPSIPLSGETFVGTQTGTLGQSWRVKVPIFDATGLVIGTVSVGTLESTLRADLYDTLPELLAWLTAAALLGSAGAIYVSRLVWRRIYRLEPEQIATLLETRDAMLHGIGEGVVAVDEEGIVALLNDEAQRLLGVDGSAIGQTAEAVLDPQLAGMVGSGSLDQTVLVGERVLLVRADDARVEHRRVGSVLILRDRTELHRLLVDLDGERDVTQALRAQAHEFSNKMHIISGLLELGRTADAVSFISRSGQGGSVISGSLAPGITDPDAASLLMVKSTIAAEKGIELRVEESSTLTADGTTDTVTVLGNLIDNAIEAIGSNGVIQVLLADGPGTGRTIVVVDDGPGIAPTQSSTIFDAGFSTKNVTGPRSRGFGLALVRRIAVRRAGSVEVDRTPDGGTRFTVVLGATVAADEASINAADSTPAMGTL
ncbi:MAG: ATP-binding protein [Microbacteriaceae bacterium]